MEIKIEKWVKGVKCIYIIHFDTGYYYIGSTKCFHSRTRIHQTNLRNYPEKFGVGIFHNPTKCNVFVLKYYSDYEMAVQRERDFIIMKSSDTFLLNKNTYFRILNNLNEELCKRMNDLKK